MSINKSPTEFLNEVVGKPVIVKLNNGRNFRGILSCLDGYMNLVLEQSEEYQDSELRAKHGDAFIRGNNVFYIGSCTSTNT